MNGVKKKVVEGLDWCKEKIEDGWLWVKDNKDVIIVMVPVVVGAIAEARRIGDRIEAKKEEKERLYYIYNPSTHTKVHTKRKLTPSIEREITIKQNSGEKISDILIDMNLV